MITIRNLVLGLAFGVLATGAAAQSEGQIEAQGEDRGDTVVTRVEPAPQDAGLEKDVRRLVALWREMRERFGAGGPYLFGEWSIPDAFFTPAAARIRHFGIDLAAHGDDGVAQAYVETLLAQPDFLQWEAEALAAIQA